jgi:hypothetical protein
LTDIVDYFVETFKNQCYLIIRGTDGRSIPESSSYELVATLHAGCSLTTETALGDYRITYEPRGQYDTLTSEKAEIRALEGKLQQFIQAPCMNLRRREQQDFVPRALLENIQESLNELTELLRYCDFLRPPNTVQNYIWMTSNEIYKNTIRMFFTTSHTSFLYLIQNNLKQNEELDQFKREVSDFNDRLLSEAKRNLESFAAQKTDYDAITKLVIAKEFENVQADVEDIGANIIQMTQNAFNDSSIRQAFIEACKTFIIAKVKSLHFSKVFSAEYTQDIYFTSMMGIDFLNETMTSTQSVQILRHANQHLFSSAKGTFLNFLQTNAMNEKNPYTYVLLQFIKQGVPFDQALTQMDAYFDKNGNKLQDAQNENIERFLEMFQAEIPQPMVLDDEQEVINFLPISRMQTLSLYAKRDFVPFFVPNKHVLFNMFWNNLFKNKSIET